MSWYYHAAHENSSNASFFQISTSAMLPMEGVLTCVPTLTVPMSVPVQLKVTSWEKMNTLVLVRK